MDVPSDISWPPAGFLHSNGFYAFPTEQGDGILLFDTAGRYERTIGRKGSGPGEYRHAYLVVPGPADSIFVFDRTARSATAYDSKWNLARTFRTEVSAMSAAFIGNRLVASGTIRTPERIGYSLHFVASDGRGVLSSFGYNTTHDPTRPSQSYRLLSPRANRLYAVRQDRYEIEEWDEQGTLIRILRRGVSWFPDRHEERTGPLLESRPDPWIAAIWTDGSGHLWVAANVPREDYALRQQQLRERSGDRVGHVELGALYRTVLEAIDLEGGRVIATTVIPHHVSWATASGLLFVREVDDVRGAVVSVFRAALVGS